MFRRTPTVHTSHTKELARLFTLLSVSLKENHCFEWRVSHSSVLISMSVFAALRWFNFNLRERPSDINPEASEWIFLLSLMWRQGIQASPFRLGPLVPYQGHGAPRRIPACMRGEKGETPSTSETAPWSWRAIDSISLGIPPAATARAL